MPPRRLCALRRGCCSATARMLHLRRCSDKDKDQPDLTAEQLRWCAAALDQVISKIEALPVVRSDVALVGSVMGRPS
eukprot:scaffold29226_cov110-Isochrysis_galbana.AAC.2